MAPSVCYCHCSTRRPGLFCVCQVGIHLGGEVTRRAIVSLVGALSLSLLFAPAIAGPAQAASGQFKIAVNPSGEVYNNEDVSLAADFPTGKYDEGTYGNYPYLSVFASADGTTFEKVAPGAKSDKAGKLTLTYNVGTAKSWAKVCNDKDKPNGQSGKLFNDKTKEYCTNAVEFTPVEPPPSSATLTVNPDGKSATATFEGGAKKSGQAANLQIKTIETKMTGEVLAGKSSWKTIASGKQDANGVVKFTISDPYEVAHEYRAVSGKFNSDSVTLDQAALNSSLGKKATGVPQVHFNTNEQAKVNTRDRYFEGRFVMLQADKNAQYTECASATVNKKDKPLLGALKGRGNYSWTFPKKGFTLKLDDKMDLCGMGANKKWALVSNHYDKSLLRNSVASYVGSKLTNLGFTPEARPVDFWMNGVYQGSYVLTERVSSDPDTRVPYKGADDQTVYDNDPASTPGFILEWDFRKDNDTNIKVNSRGYVGVKDPEFEYDKITGVKDEKESISKAQVTYITNYLKDCDNKLFGADFKHATKGWRSCIDEASAVDYYIAQELMKPVDGNMWASVYMYKLANGKLKMGPMWDYDLAAGSANRAGGAVNPTGFYLRNVIKTSAKQSDKTWFNRLNEDPAFKSAVRARWNSVYNDLKGSDAHLATQSSKISSSASENFKKWDVKRKDSKVQIVKGSWSAEVSYLRSWMKSRITWMNANL